MFTLKKSLLLLFFLGTINLSLCKEERDADEERRDDPDKRDVEVEKRFLSGILKLAFKIPSVLCAVLKNC
uniref:Pleurain-D1 antimicrobial peptide n=1 Tax=Nidirana pleuraden TaxID=369511 RepID=B5L1C3_NIDPL|nr:pleurain-D1 antimicrobial peptide precursor [Nidirana pleuraden]ABX58860.1 pleurain-D1 antimicrobial peptide precursor [Nidirana pleuraden]